MANDAQMPDVRRWDYYPIEMPLTGDGKGPATVGVDAVRITYEVWDRDLLSHASYDNLPGAINEAMRLNAALPSDPAADLCASGQQVRGVDRLTELADLIDHNITGNELTQHRLLLDGEVYTGPAVDWAHRVMTGLRDLMRRYAALTPAPQPAGEAVPVAWRARRSESEEWQHFTRRPSWWEVQALFAHPPQPSEPVAEALKLAAARLQRLALEIPSTTSLRAEAFEWADEALRALKGGEA